MRDSDIAHLENLRAGARRLSVMDDALADSLMALHARFVTLLRDLEAARDHYEQYDDCVALVRDIDMMIEDDWVG